MVKSPLVALIKGRSFNKSNKTAKKINKIKYNNKQTMEREEGD